MNPSSANSLSSMEYQTIGKTFLQARIFNADQIKKSLPGADWLQFFEGFLRIAQEALQPNNGQIIKLSQDGFLAVFDHQSDGIQGAIDLQEGVETGPRNLSCAIGVACGPAYAFSLPSSAHIDYLGTPVDVAQALAQRARGNAILYHDPAPNPGGNISISSIAGESVNRPAHAYFVGQSPVKLATLSQPLPSYSIFWQGEPSHFLATSPVEEAVSSSDKSKKSVEEQIHFGRVSAFKKERGFGFIQYYTNEQEYMEIYFHMTYVINQISVQEHDHVQFTVKPGKEGRPQACSVLIMGSRLQGQVEFLDADGSGHITIHNQDSGLIRFFILPQEVKTPPLQVNDIVDFTVGSGSEVEGLIALDIRDSDGEATPSELTGSGDNIQLGSIERAVITVYFEEKGYGFAKCRRNNVYVHVSELTTPEVVPSPGDIIEFEVSAGRDGTYRANNIHLVLKKGLSL
ncbi:MAG: cold shock domain-containing protein [Magnetococcales bacterium]|nr:cold shock domain-containing protein [Magnetococcales bacterium]